MDFWIGLFGLLIGIVGLIGIFTQHRKAWTFGILLFTALTALGIVCGKFFWEEAIEKRKVNAAEAELLGTINREGPRSFQQLLDGLHYPDIEIASKAIDDLEDQHQVQSAVTLVKDGDGNSYTVRIYRPHLRVKRFNLLEESSYTENGNTGWLRELVNRSSTTYICKNFEDLNIVFVALIDGYGEGDHMNTDVEMKIDFLDSSKKVLSSQSAYRTYNVSDWRTRPTASQLGADKVVVFLQIPPVDVPSSPIVYIMACRKFQPNEIVAGPVLLHLTIKDNLGTSEASFDQPIEVRKE